MLDLGALGPFGSVADAINDAGTVAGYSEGPEGGPFSLRAFRWTRAKGIDGIGTLPSEFTFASDINAAGHIVGESPFTPGAEPHAFFWTRRSGLVDLGTGSNNRSIAYAINDHDVVVGQTLRQFVGPAHGFVWTQATGLVELRSQSSDAFGSANDVNNRGQVVGGIDNHAFLWTRSEGVTDLNTRLRDAPDGLTLIVATGISDNGSIVAIANTGLVLLVPQCGCAHAAPIVGAVAVTGTARTGVPLSFSAAFKDIDVNDTHKANWSWGDGSSDASLISEKNGVGSASAQHAYGVPGIYTVTLALADSSGKRTAVQRKIAVGDSGAYVAGHGWFISPPGASGRGRNRTAIATFAVLSGAGGASVQFDAAGIRFRSEQIASQPVPGPGVRYRGRGSVNGTGGYNVMMSSVPGSAAERGTERIRVRIWHEVPGSKAEVVDYDNVRGRGAAMTDPGGTVMGEGGLTFQSN